MKSRRFRPPRLRCVVVPLLQLMPVRSSPLQLHQSILPRWLKSPPREYDADSVSFPPGVDPKAVHEAFMDMALDEASRAGMEGEVPVGALVVREIPDRSTASGGGGINRRPFQILSRGRNLVETKSDASAHAEMEALRSASSRTGNWRLLNVTLYTTLEPCPMCLSAAQAFRVRTVVYGAKDLRLGALGTHLDLLGVAAHPFHDQMEAWGGVREDESSTLMKEFFRERRRESKRKALQEKKERREGGGDGREANPSRSSELQTIGWAKRLRRRLYDRVMRRQTSKVNGIT